MIIDSSGIVMCSNQRVFACLSENCYCNDLGQLLHDLRGGTNNTMVNIAEKAIVSYSVLLQFLTNVLIFGQNNLTVFCMNTQAIIIDNCNNLTIQGITWIGCGSNEYAIAERSAAILIYSSSVIIQRNSFQYSIGSAIQLKFLVVIFCYD